MGRYHGQACLRGKVPRPRYSSLLSMLRLRMRMRTRTFPYAYVTVTIGKLRLTGLRYSSLVALPCLALPCLVFHSFASHATPFHVPQVPLLFLLPLLLSFFLPPFFLSFFSILSQPLTQPRPIYLTSCNHQIDTMPSVSSRKNATPSSLPNSLHINTVVGAINSNNP